MADDRQLLIGKWTVWVKDWVWEYEFSPDGTVIWRDTRSSEKGTGRWSINAKLVNLSWVNSVTKESWQLPLSASRNRRTWYAAPYFTGPYQIEKKIELELPKSVSVDRVGPEGAEIDIDTDPQSESNYIDRLCTHVAYGIYLGGFWVYVPENISPYPIEIPEKLVYFGSTGQRVSDVVYENQAAALQVSGGVNPNSIAYYMGVGGKIICPTAFTMRSAPTIVNTASIVVDRLVAEVTEELKDIMMMLVLRIAVSTAGDIIGRAAEVRRLKAREARAKAAIDNARARQNAARPAPARTLKIDSAQFGAKAGKHLQDFGKNPGSAADRKWLEDYIRDIHQSPSQIREGTFSGQARSYRAAVTPAATPAFTLRAKMSS